VGPTQARVLDLCLELIGGPPLLPINRLNIGPLDPRQDHYFLQVTELGLPTKDHHQLDPVDNGPTHVVPQVDDRPSNESASEARLDALCWTRLVT
jgi:hypothetical protein